MSSANPIVDFDNEFLEKFYSLYNKNYSDVLNQLLRIYTELFRHYSMPSFRNPDASAYALREAGSRAPIASC